jgi:dihydrofolate reductase
MKLSVFCGVSVDGFLARPNHTVDFLRTGEQVPHGFEEFYGSVDVVVIGRRTYEFVLTFGKWLYGKKPVVVLSSGPLDFSWIKGGVVEQMSGEPVEIVAGLKARSFKHAYIDGGVTIQRFLAAGLIDRLVITRVPVLIGEGIPLFGRCRTTSVFAMSRRVAIVVASCRVNMSLPGRGELDPERRAR